MEQIEFARWAALERDEHVVDNPLSRAVELYRAMALARAAAALEIARTRPGFTVAARVDGRVRIDPGRRSARRSQAPQRRVVRGVGIDGRRVVGRTELIPAPA